MTISGKTHANAGQGSNLKPECYEAYAQYVVDVLQLYQQNDIPVKHISPINEPQWAWEGGQEVFITAEKTTLKKCKTILLSIQYTPENAFPPGIQWKSSSETVALVDKNGKVTACNPGTTVITAEDPSLGLSAQITLTVTNKSVPAVPATGGAVLPVLLLLPMLLGAAALFLLRKRQAQILKG